MDEFNELYEYSKNTLKLFKFYEFNSSEDTIKMIDDSLKKENSYLSNFSLSSIKQLMSLVNRGLDSNSDNYDDSVDNELILSHMFHVLMSELIYTNLFENNSFSISRHDANYIFGNAMIDGLINIGIFLNKYISNSLSQVFDDCSESLSNEYYVYSPYYYSFKDILNHKKVKLDWKDEKFFSIYLLDIFNYYNDFLLNKKENIMDSNIIKKLYANLPIDCSNVDNKKDVIQQLFGNNKDYINYIPEGDSLSFRFLFPINVKDYYYKYDFETSLRFSKMIDMLLDSGQSVYELLNKMMYSNNITKNKYIDDIDDILSMEYIMLDTLGESEVEPFINYLKLCYIGDFDNIMCYKKFLQNGDISYNDMRSLSARRLYIKLLYSREKLIYDNYCFFEMNKFLYLNTIAELFSNVHLNVNDSVLRDKIAYLLLYSNALEGDLVEYNNVFQYENLFSQIVKDDDYLKYINQFIGDMDKVKKFDRDSNFKGVFIDAFVKYALRLIDFDRYNEIQNKKDDSIITLSKSNKKE